MAYCSSGPKIMADFQSRDYSVHPRCLQYLPLQLPVEWPKTEGHIFNMGIILIPKIVYVDVGVARVREFQTDRICRLLLRLIYCPLNYNKNATLRHMY